MPVNRGTAASWAIGLGILLAAVAGSVVSARTPAQEMRHVGGFALLFVPALYVAILDQWERWMRKHPFVRFVVGFIGGFTAIVVLGLIASTVFGGFGIGTAVAEFLAAIAGFGVAVWLVLYGGDERLWMVLIDRFDVDW